MKSYFFAKLLPVGGEVKLESDTAKNKNGYPLFMAHDGRIIAASEVRDGIVWSHFNNFKIDECRCLKLFLCSRDIPKQGDLAFPIAGAIKTLQHHNLEEQKLGIKFIKVIGEISPEATWVKEGDEFGEDEVRFWGTGYKKDIARYEIKGPCGHFH